LLTKGFLADDFFVAFFAGIYFPFVLFITT